MREAQTMRQQSHPCVLPLYCSFVHEQNLWMVMPYVAGGSVLNIMKYAYPEVRRLPFLHCHLGLHYSPSSVLSLPTRDKHLCLFLVQGLEEPVIATILKEVLKGLEYMHRQGGIHRDVKVQTALTWPA